MLLQEKVVVGQHETPQEDESLIHVNTVDIYSYKIINYIQSVQQTCILNNVI